jgi:hypothetical protein
LLASEVIHSNGFYIIGRRFGKSAGLLDEIGESHYAVSRAEERRDRRFFAGGRADPYIVCIW